MKVSPSYEPGNLSAKVVSNEPHRTILAIVLGVVAIVFIAWLFLAHH